jgi:hypothetical protein
MTSRIAPLLAVLALAPTTALADTLDLIAGQHEVAGQLTVTNDADNLYVSYDADTDWFIDAVHVAVGYDVSELPQTKKGNPAIGNFAYAAEFELSDGADLTIPLADIGFTSGDQVTIAAHAEVRYLTGYVGDIAELELAESVSFSVAYPGGDSYFDTTISGEGTFDGFCVDLDHYITPGVTYSATPVSSYDAAASLLVDNPENLDLVNYIINQDYIGEWGATWREIQRAIWVVIDDRTSDIGGSDTLVDDIVEDALVNGEGFIPGADERVAVILEPGLNSAGEFAFQATIAAYDVPTSPVYTGETAWADGYDFGGKSWAMAFDYTLD